MSLLEYDTELQERDKLSRHRNNFPQLETMKTLIVKKNSKPGTPGAPTNSSDEENQAIFRC